MTEMDGGIRGDSSSVTSAENVALRCARLPGEIRCVDLIHEHYVVERELAERLRSAGPAERPQLYLSVYDELFERVPHHQQLTRQMEPAEQREELQRQLGFLQRFLNPEDHLLEVGAGDCAFSVMAKTHCAQVTAVDVAEIHRDSNQWPEGVSFRLLPDGQIPEDLSAIDVAYSNQLMEHLHPDDAVDQLAAICRSLRPGGRYVCVTPNSVSGPWDISMYFDEQATGLHLKEYRLGELVELFRRAGFNRVHCYGGGRGFFARVPRWLVSGVESVLSAMPYTLRARIARTLPVRGLLGLRVVGYKD